MVSYSELKKGVRIVLENDPYEIIESSSMFKARGHSVLQTKLRNLKTGRIISKTFHPSDSFEEPEISRIGAKFLYSHKEKYVFSEHDNPSKRFDLKTEQVGDKKEFLKENQIVEALVFKDKVINISLPIKINLKVTQAPPSVKGERAQSGTKTVILETGTKLNAPSFIETGDIIEVNTESGEYVRRIE
ncbi:MAG: elongation factor P [Patescibacteria group bacterium]|nr:elongation factor P [Patescibacteria group bacterium]